MPMLMTMERLLLLCALMAPAFAQAGLSTLPAPSSPLYQCEANGKVSYSHSPCRNTQNITGQEEASKDLDPEKQREAFAEALKPLTGTDVRQYDAHSRRMRLEPEDRGECHSLERRINTLEESERTAKYLRLREIQRELLSKRERYHELGC